MKKVLLGIGITSMVAVATWSVSVNSQTNDMSDMSLANVKVLANNERPTEEECKAWCYSICDYDCVLVTNLGNEYTCENAWFMF